MLTTAPNPNRSLFHVAASSSPIGTATLDGRLSLVRRRRLVLRLRDWFGITFVVGLSMALFAVTLFSLIGR